MCDRGYPGYLFGGTPVSSWDRGFNSLENQIQQQYRGRNSSGRYWGSMSEGGGISAAGGDSCKTNLIVNYLPQTMTEKDLYAMFMAIGPIESCRVMKDFKTGYSYGFGFVNFTREEDASRAIDTFNGYQLRNKRLKVSYARPSGDDIKDTNLYVTNLPRAITEDQLQTIFGKYGRIVQKHILRDKSSGTPRGVAFVRFDKREEAQEAIAALNNVIPEGGTEPLSVKWMGADVCRDKRSWRSDRHRRNSDNCDTTWLGADVCCSRGTSSNRLWRTHSQHPLPSDNCDRTWLGADAMCGRSANTTNRLWRTHSHQRLPNDSSDKTLWGADVLCNRGANTTNRLWRTHSQQPLPSDSCDRTVAEEHGKQKAAYYAGWAAGFNHNRAAALPQRHHSLDQLDMLQSRLDYPTSYGMQGSTYNRYPRRDVYTQPSYMPHHRPF